MQYNGWRNRETWLINIWFNPEVKSDIELIREKIESDYDSLPDYMKDFIDLDCIDWDELIESLDEEDNEDNEE